MEAGEWRSRFCFCGFASLLQLQVSSLGCVLLEYCLNLLISLINISIFWNFIKLLSILTKNLSAYSFRNRLMTNLWAANIWLKGDSITDKFKFSSIQTFLWSKNNLLCWIFSFGETAFQKRSFCCKWRFEGGRFNSWGRWNILILHFNNSTLTWNLNVMHKP